MDFSLYSTASSYVFKYLFGWEGIEVEEESHILKDDIDDACLTSANDTLEYLLRCDKGRESFMWATMYIVIVPIFWLCSSPFHRRFRHRTWVHPYYYLNLIALCWICVGLVTATSFLPSSKSRWNAPATLIVPIFWASLGILMFADFLLYATHSYYKQGKSSFSKYMYEKMRPKFRISFGRSLTEAIASSFALSILCCIVHANSYVTSIEEPGRFLSVGNYLLRTSAPYKRQWTTYLETNFSYAFVVVFYLFGGGDGDENNSTDTTNITFLSASVERVLASDAFNLWVTLLALLVVNHVMERVANVRAVFYDNVSPDARAGHDDEEPQNMPEMCNWFEMSVATTGLEMLLQLKIGSRFDMRHLLKAKLESTEESAECEGGSAGGGIASTGGATKAPSDDTKGGCCEQQRFAQDPFFYDHSKDGEENDSPFVLDFMADCGDGFHPSYTISRALAQPSLVCTFKSSQTDDKYEEAVVDLKRGHVLLVGGDLAYPLPTPKEYRTRFVRVFEDALPVGTHAPSSKTAPPTAYALVGNHDCFDGLKCFLDFVVFSTTLGGWRMPQKKTYFCLKLPCDWYLFCLDCGLQADIDYHQYEHFARLARTLVRSNPQAKFIAAQHDPRWINAWYDREREHPEYQEPYLDKLLRVLSVEGRLRLRIAGDIHNYQRHVPANVDSKDAPVLVVSGGGGAFLHPTHVDDLGANDFTYLPRSKGGGTTYTRRAAFPSGKVSAGLSFDNVTKFRSRNLYFDLVGGVLYLGLAHALFAQCEFGDVTLPIIPARKWVCESANDTSEACLLWYATGGVLLESIVSIPMAAASNMLNMLVADTTSVITAALAFVVLVCFADHHRSSVRFLVGSVHWLAHVFGASVVGIAIEWVLRTIASTFRGSADTDLHAQWISFSSSFPAIAATIQESPIGDWTFGFFPWLLKASMVMTNNAHAQIVLKERMCSGDADAQDRALFYTIRVIWYFVFASLMCSSIFGTYLACMVGLLRRHWNEGFSSLQNRDFKHFVRMQIDRTTGDLEAFVVGFRRIPDRWRRRRPGEPGPSKWMPKNGTPPEIVDYWRLSGGAVPASEKEIADGDSSLRKRWRAARRRVIERRTREARVEGGD